MMDISTLSCEIHHHFQTMKCGVGILQEPGIRRDGHLLFEVEMYLQKGCIIGIRGWFKLDSGR